MVCNKEAGFGEDDFVVEFLGEVRITFVLPLLGSLFFSQRSLLEFRRFKVMFVNTGHIFLGLSCLEMV